MGEAALEVVAGALIDAAGRILIAQRPAGRSRAGRWELPGGKREHGEPAFVTLRRELKEELGISVGRARPLMTCRHRYPGERFDVRIEAWRVQSWTGEPTALDGQALYWCPRRELPGADLLEADRPIVTALWLPRLFVHVPSPPALAEGLGRARGRIGWLLEACPPAALIAAAAAKEHWVGVIDPGGPLPFGVAAVYSPRVLKLGIDVKGAGTLAYDLDDARRSIMQGAGFLLLPDAHAAPSALSAIAELGLPYYLNAAGPRARQPMAAATGRLLWPRSP